MKSALVFVLASLAAAAPHMSIVKRQKPCFVVGNEQLPAEVQKIADGLVDKVTCDPGAQIIEGIPNVSAGGMSFAEINFVDSGESPLAFALKTFPTADVVANSNADAFQSALDIYLATEAGVRSVGGNLAIKVPKFFLQFQMTRINAAKGIKSDVPGFDVQHQLEKVLTNAAGEDKALLDQVKKLATTLK